MIKPQDKAKELYDKFLPIVRQSDLYDTYHNKAKELATIFCDEAHELLNKPMFQYKESMLWKAEFDYWQKVKQEVSLL